MTNYDDEIRHVEDVAERERDRWVTENNQLKTDLAAANAIIEKLPLTADGVPVVPGMKVHCFHSDYGIIQWTIKGSFDIEDACMSEDEFYFRPAEWWTHCYSTREAAEAAKEAADAK